MNYRSQMFILAAGFTLTITFLSAAYMEPPPSPLSFQDRWAGTATLAATSERIEALNKPRVVQVETVKPEPDPPARMDVLQTVGATASARRQAAVAGDICARHGLKKIITDNGRSWRCAVK